MKKTLRNLFRNKNTRVSSETQTQQDGILFKKKCFYAIFFFSGQKITAFPLPKGLANGGFSIVKRTRWAGECHLREPLRQARPMPEG